MADHHEHLATVEALADELNGHVLPTARARLQAMGETESGAYNFYATRIGRDDLFGNYEKALAAALLAAGMPPAVHEIGGGFGTLCWLTAGLGAKSVCLEHDRRRFEGAQALWVPIAMARPDLAARLEIRRERFPAAGLRPGRATAIATNLVYTTTPEARRAIIAALAGYREAIIDLDRFLASTGPDERQGTVDEFAAAGMTGEPFLDLGASACFWRFSAVG